MDNLVSQCSDNGLTCSVDVIGQSVEGRDLKVLRVRRYLAFAVILTLRRDTPSRRVSTTATHVTRRSYTVPKPVLNDEIMRTSERKCHFLGCVQCRNMQFVNVLRH